ncbi:uncharacterized protein TNCV_3559781 [Trichonephila clavipes]|uniref:Uncharacterized protein n=1 Tax=Trichonephila clavipes TaxID=2585209 RepID=A0A8X6WCX7_TRICX|nr:uncharacterized protein TNCV_3559781 [Trichonephila clavipes]
MAIHITQHRIPECSILFLFLPPSIYCLSLSSKWGCGSPVVMVLDHGRYVMSSSPVPLKTRRVGRRCTLNLSRAETSSRWCGGVVRRGGCQLRCRPRHLTILQNYVIRRPRVAEQYDINIQSIT